MNKKQLWILVGGNGAGKSTFYSLYLEPLNLPFVNADRIAKETYPENPEEHSYDAAKLAEELRTQLLLSGASFCFETVYSHPSKIDFVAQAKALGYEVIMVFIHLHMTMLNQARIAQRVREGGHFVPESKVLKRIPKTLQNVKKSIALCDQIHVIDNSSTEQPFKRVLLIQHGKIKYSARILPDWVSSILLS
ncbi:hypothetical protein D5085_00740 [Ectothiorhodospiraceae bacterium BW-2]|nr:hypothetical protein D5085_00740 [Ectothiorhodospiraceae bacterium BW-2]